MLRENSNLGVACEGLPRLLLCTQVDLAINLLAVPFNLPYYGVFVKSQLLLLKEQ